MMKKRKYHQLEAKITSDSLLPEETKELWKVKSTKLEPSASVGRCTEAGR